MLNLRNPREYIENLLFIRTKSGEETRLRMKPAQQKLYKAVREQARAGKPVRVIVLKARQMGFSTLISGLIFHACATQENRNAMIVAHVNEATRNLHQMHRRFYDRLPAQLQPMRAASNVFEMRFESPTKDPEEKAAQPGLRSRIRCATAGGSGIGRSDTLQYLHVSEYAFWPEGQQRSKSDTLLGMLQAVPAEAGTMVFLESTPNGYDDFKRRWDDAVAGRSDYVPLFFAWFEEPDYRRPVAPGTVWTEEERELAARFGLDDEQLAWRRWCLANNCGGDIDKFHQEYPATPEEAFVASGDCYFDTAIVSARLQELREQREDGRLISGATGREVDGGTGAPSPTDAGERDASAARKSVPYGGERIATAAEPPRNDRNGSREGDGGKARTGRFVYRVVYDEALQHTTLEDVRFVEAKDGPITLYCEPQERTPYVLGGDTAGEGSDWFGAYVIDNTDCRTVAKLHQICDEAEYARQVFCLGQFFNDALVGPETNFSTYPVALLQTMGYKRLYVRQRMDSFTHKLRESFGHVTDRVTRPAMLAQFKEIFEAHPELFPDEELLQEMLAFVKNERGRPEALSGAHDDLVMSMAITLFIREQQSSERKPAPHEKAVWRQDMYDDYYSADAATRRKLIEMWGDPF